MFADELVKLGLSKGEAEVYSNLVQFGDASASELAKKTDIGRTNIYEYANMLMKRGLVTQFEKSNKIFFRAEDPMGLRDLLEEKQGETRDLALQVANMLPRMEELYNQGLNKPQVKYLHGDRAHKELMDKIYNETDDSEIYILTRDLDLYEPPEPKLRNAFMRKQIFTNLIVNEGKSIIEFNKRDHRELRKTLLLPRSAIAIKTDMVLFGDSFVFGNIAKEDFAVTLIRNGDLVLVFKSVFADLVRRNSTVSE